jgi:hypothetical protein
LDDKVNLVYLIDLVLLGRKYSLRERITTRRQWLTPVFLATQEEEIRRITV